MAKVVNVEAIVNKIESKQDFCFTNLERTLLEIAVLEGAMATINIEREEIKELQKLRVKFNNSKKNWFTRLFKGIK